jgi:hypothetical protein
MAAEDYLRSAFALHAAMSVGYDTAPVRVVGYPLTETAADPRFREAIDAILGPAEVQLAEARAEVERLKAENDTIRDRHYFAEDNDLTHEVHEAEALIHTARDRITELETQNATLREELDRARTERAAVCGVIEDALFPVARGADGRTLAEDVALLVRQRDEARTAPRPGSSAVQVHINQPEPPPRIVVVRDRRMPA